MQTKRTILILALAALAASAAFASGDKDDDPWTNPRGFGGGPRMAVERPVPWDESDVEVYEGRYRLVDDLYPALETDGGDLWYLMIRYPVAEDAIPEDGADIRVEAVRAPMSPVHLMVLSAEVDGEVLESEWPDDGAWGEPPQRGRGGPRGGGFGRGGMGGYGRGGFGGYGGGPCWGFPESEPGAG